MPKYYFHGKRNCVPCPICKDGTLTGSVSIVPEERQTRDYPGSPAYIEEVSNVTCVNGCEISASQVDALLEDELFCDAVLTAAWDEANPPEPDDEPDYTLDPYGYYEDD